jgi:hypothetical protein
MDLANGRKVNLRWTPSEAAHTRSVSRKEISYNESQSNSISEGVSGHFGRANRKSRSFTGPSIATI